MRHLFPILIGCVALIAVSSCNEKTNEQSTEKVKSTETIPSLNIKTTRSIGWDDKQACLAYYIENGDTIKLSARIKCRGGASSKYIKHSYSIEFEKDLAICGIASDDDWILNASYIDKTFQRHKLSYDLFRQMSSENIASQCGYIKVYLNGKYAGLYIAMEEINGSMIGIEKTDRDAMLFKDPPVFYKERLKKFQDSNNYYQQKFPKIYDHDKSPYLSTFNQMLFNSTDVEFAEQIGDWIDLKNIVDWHLILLLTNNDDGLFKNFYLYRHNSPSLKMAIWDYDHSFGRDGDGAINMMEREVGWEKIVLLKRLMEIESMDYPEKLKKRWQELRSNGVFTIENIEKMIAENSKLIKPNIEENFEKWPLKSKWYEDENNYDQEIGIIKEFTQKRLTYLDDYFQRL